MHSDVPGWSRPQSLLSALKDVARSVLGGLGLLNAAVRVRADVSERFRRARYRRLVAAGPSKDAYLQSFDAPYKPRLGEGGRVWDVAVDRYTSQRRGFEWLLSRKRGDFPIIETGC